MKYVFRIIPGLLLLAVMAGGITAGSWWLYSGRLRQTPPQATAGSVPSLSAAVPTTTVTPQPRTATVTADVNLRADQSTTAPVVAQLKSGAAVTLVNGQTAPWQRVQVGSLIGYIYSAYLAY